jgi:hypothetical protein
MTCGGEAILAIEQETRTYVATFMCPACGASNNVALTVRSSGMRVRVNIGGDEEDDDGDVLLTPSQRQMVSQELNLKREGH